MPAPQLKVIRTTAVCALLILGLWGNSGVGRVDAASRPPQAAPANALVIAYKDGHKQTLNVAAIARLEFSEAVPSGLISVPGPSRAHYLGKWQVGEGNGDNFTILLREDGTALRSIGHERGSWQYVNGEAQVTWDDGWHDAIRKVDGWYKKYAYGEGKSFDSEPDNVTNARNLTVNPTGVD